MAGTSKNQRKASVPSSTAGFQMQRDMRLLIPLHEGHVYLLDPRNGKNLHLKLQSDRGRAEIARVAADGHADRLRAEIDTLSVKYPDPGWADARAALVPAPTEEQPA
jgi:hypothetical protein